MKITGKYVISCITPIPPANDASRCQLKMQQSKSRNSRVEAKWGAKKLEAFKCPLSWWIVVEKKHLRTRKPFLTFNIVAFHYAMIRVTVDEYFLKNKKLYLDYRVLIFGNFKYRRF